MKELINFHKDVIGVFGYMTEIQLAIHFCNRWWRDSPRIVGNRSPVNEIYFGPKNSPGKGAMYAYKRTFKEMIDSSSQDGPWTVVHFRSVIVFLVALWEDHYRQRIADEVGLEKNDISSDVFRDLNRYRQAILHADNRLQKTPNDLPFLQKGDEIILTTDQMTEIFVRITEDLNRIGNQYYRRDPGLNFRRLYHPSDTEKNLSG